MSGQTRESNAAGGTTEGTVEPVVDAAKQGLEKAQEKAQEATTRVADKGAETLRGQVDRRSTTIGSQVRMTADSLREVADRAESEGNEGQARVTQQLAGRVDRVGDYLERSSGDQILSDVEGFARRQPWVVAGGAVLAGFVAARMLKASSGERAQTFAYRSPYSGEPTRDLDSRAETSMVIEAGAARPQTSGSPA